MSVDTQKALKMDNSTSRSLRVLLTQLQDVLQHTPTRQPTRPRCGRSDSCADDGWLRISVAEPVRTL